MVAIQDGVSKIPIIDLSPWTSTSPSLSNLTSGQRQVVDQVNEACRTVGFAVISQHGLDQAVEEAAWKASQDFFNLPLEEKLQHKTTNEEEYPYGYEQSEQLAKGKELDGCDGGESTADTKETFAMGPNNEASGMPLRRFIPTPTVPHFQPSMENYYQAMEELAMTLLRIFALALGQPAEYFEDKMDHHMSALRILHYYPLAEAANKTQTTDMVRAGAHTDYGALTILNAQQPGLQVQLHDSEDRSKTQWYSVPTIPGALIINLGDLMQRWTNDKWLSTLHRVVTTPAEQKPEYRRYSMAYFVNINSDTVVEPLGGENPKYPPITAKDHLMAKHLASMGTRTPEQDQ